MGGIASISSMVSGLQQSIDNALKKIQTDAAAANPAPENVERFEQDVRKSSINATPFATNIGVLAKDESRLNVFSILGKDDAVDFYKFKVTTKGEVALGRVGDSGLRVQLMDKTGKVLADSNEGAGESYEAYKKLAGGSLTLDRGDYTVRVAREKGVPATKEVQYALQLSEGTYTKDYDTFAKQPDKNAEMPSYVRTLQQLLNGGGNTSNRLSMLLGASNGSQAKGSLFDGFF